MIDIQTLPFSIDKRTFTGHLAYDTKTEQKRPAILVVPTWMGLNAFIKEKAKALAQLGYIGYAVDLFGDQKEAKNADEARELVKPLIIDRQIIRDRLQTAADTLRTHSLVDAEKVAAIGFCFGGMCVLELAKSGYNVSGVVTFHASLGNRDNLPMKPVETAQQIPASILMLHGYKDALAPEKELSALEQELDARGVDWQVHTHGQAMHAFTNPKANMPEYSLQYHEKTANRAWQAMRHFLTEVLGPV